MYPGNMWSASLFYSKLCWITVRVHRSFQFRPDEKGLERMHRMVCYNPRLFVIDILRTDAHLFLVHPETVKSVLKTSGRPIIV